MLDGEDIFSKNYQLITRNLTVDAINRIDAIENYQENELLRDIEKTGKAVLNLSVKDGLKLKNFGNGGLGAGIKNRYQGNLASFSLKNKLKFGIIGNINNIGVSPIADILFQLDTENETKKLVEQINNPLQTINQNKVISNADVEASRYVFNQVRVAGWDLNYKLKDSLKIKTFGYYLSDKNAIKTIDRTSYVLENRTINIKDSSIVNLRPSSWVGQLKLDYKINPKSTLNIISDYKTSKTRRYDFAFSENAALTENVVQNRKSESLINSNQLNYFYRLKGRNLIAFNLSYSITKLPEQVLINSSRYASFFNLNSKYDSLIQNNNTKQKDLLSTIHWKKGTSLGNFKFGIGFLNKLEKFNSNIQLSDAKSEIQLDDNYRNLLDFNKKSIYVEGLYEFNLKKAKLSLGGSTYALSTQFSNHQNQNSFSTFDILFNPTIGFSYNFNTHNGLWFYYNRLQTTPNIQDLASGYLLNSYQSFNRYLPVFNIANSDTWLLMYQNQNWSKLFSLAGSFSYSLNSSLTASSFTISDILSLTTTKPVNGKTSSFTANGQIDRFISFLSSRLQFQSNFARGTQLFLLNKDEISNSIYQFFENKLLIRSAFKGIFNFEVAGSLTNNSTILKQLKIDNIQIHPSITTKFNLIKDVTIRVKGDRIIRKQQNFGLKTNFLDADIIFEPKNSKWTFELDGLNLLDNQLLAYTSASNFSIYNKAYSLQPRMIILKIGMQF